MLTESECRALVEQTLALRRHHDGCTWTIDTMETHDWGYIVLCETIMAPREEDHNYVPYLVHGNARTAVATSVGSMPFDIKNLCDRFGSKMS